MAAVSDGTMHGFHTRGFPNCFIISLMQSAMTVNFPYYNNEGRPSEAARQNGPHGGGAPAFIRILEDWRSEGTLAGLEPRT